jgi:hypothetical protein
LKGEKDDFVYESSRACADDDETLEKEEERRCEAKMSLYGGGVFVYSSSSTVRGGFGRQRGGFTQDWESRERVARFEESRYD